MSPRIQETTRLLPYLTDEQQGLILAIVENFLPDDIATPADLAAIKQAREEYARGEFFTMEDVLALDNE